MFENTNVSRRAVTKECASQMQTTRLCRDNAHRWIRPRASSQESASMGTPMTLTRLRSNSLMPCANRLQ